MEIKDYLLIGIGILGWIWAVIQFVLNRRYSKSDKALEKRFEVYSNFMNKMDEMYSAMRNDPSMFYGIPEEAMSKILTGDEDQINDALIQMNANLLDTTKRSIQPMLIITQELNKLRLVSSDDLLLKINEYKKLVQDYTNDLQNVLNRMASSSDLEKNAKELESVGQHSRNERMQNLWTEIETSMRNEIDYYKK